jgi:hypothetical protein
MQRRSRASSHVGSALITTPSVHPNVKSVQRNYKQSQPPLRYSVLFLPCPSLSISFVGCESEGPKNRSNRITCLLTEELSSNERTLNEDDRQRSSQC